MEQRIRISETRYRVPDVAVFRRDQPIEQVFTHPPLIIIEILSPRDSLRTIENRVQDYLNFGVDHIWVIDPAQPVEAWVATREQLTRAGDPLEIPGTPLYLTISELEL